MEKKLRLNTSLNLDEVLKINFSDKKLLLINCPKCQNIPFITFLSPSDKVSINCSYCKKTTKIEIENYLSLLKEPPIKKKKNKCEIHSIPFKNFCPQCLEYFCSKCDSSQKHFGHPVFLLGNSINSEIIKEKINVLTEGKKYFINYMKEFKEKIMKNLSQNNINYAIRYQIIPYIKLIKNFFLLSDSIIDNYHLDEPNFYQEKNIFTIIDLLQEPLILRSLTNFKNDLCSNNLNFIQQKDLILNYQKNNFLINGLKSLSFAKEEKSITLDTNLLDIVFMKDNKNLIIGVFEDGIKIIDIKSGSICFIISQEIQDSNSYSPLKVTSEEEIRLISMRYQFLSLLDNNLLVCVYLNTRKIKINKKSMLENYYLVNFYNVNDFEKKKSEETFFSSFEFSTEDNVKSIRQIDKNLIGILNNTLLKIYQVDINKKQINIITIIKGNETFYMGFIPEIYKDFIIIQSNSLLLTLTDKSIIAYSITEYKTIKKICLGNSKYNKLEKISDYQVIIGGKDIALLNISDWSIKLLYKFKIPKYEGNEDIYNLLDYSNFNKINRNRLICLFKYNSEHSNLSYVTVFNLNDLQIVVKEKYNILFNVESQEIYNFHDFYTYYYEKTRKRERTELFNNLILIKNEEKEEEEKFIVRTKNKILFYRIKI